jgi:hypothetical protein
MGSSREEYNKQRAYLGMGLDKSRDVGVVLLRQVGKVQRLLKHAGAVGVLVAVIGYCKSTAPLSGAYNGQHVYRARAQK